MDRQHIRLSVMFPRLFHLLVLSATVSASTLEPCPFDLYASPGWGAQLSWESQNGRYYDLWSSEDLSLWAPMDGYPRQGTGNIMHEWMRPASQAFFRMASSTSLESFLLPEVATYKTATGITLEAASEINLFLRHLRGAGVEPVLFWVGGSRYKSISGSTARAVIGGNGTVTGVLGLSGERYETFNGTQALRFPNPFRDMSQSRIGLFAGASTAQETGANGLITGGESSPRGPRLASGWGAGDFLVFNATGQALTHSSFGGFVQAGVFLPYVGGAYDGYYSVLCGVGKSVGSGDNPLRYYGMPPEQFPNNEFVNSQNHIDLGSPYFSGNLHFAVATAADLTDNRRAYDIISIPRRSGFGTYGTQSAAVFLGDSITVWSNQHIWNSDGQVPPHKGGGQWNRNCLGLLANATGEGNEAQIRYFEQGAKYALDPRTWNHLFFVCGSGGHYRYADHTLQNPLSQEARDSIDAWIEEYHERIALPAAELGATVVQMTYIYGCPQKVDPPRDPQIYRTFMDYFVAKQREVALSAGFPIFDVYSIPQLHAPIPAFYSDQIHPSPAGCRLIAQEFAATIANPTSRAPRSLSRPGITGTAKTGSVLNASRGSWSFTPTYHAYQWMRDATDIPGASSSSYTIMTADIGFHISCRITAKNSYGSAERTTGHTPMVVP
jgi:hypothetical protein